MIVNDELVHVDPWLVPVSVAVGLWAFPALMHMLMMRIVKVAMLVLHLMMGVLQRRFVPTRPHQHGDNCSRKRHQTQSDKSTGHTKLHAQPSSKWIADQPAGMRQRKLSCKQRRSVALVARLHQ